MSNPIIQICFSLKNGLTIETLKTKLINLKTKLDSIYGNNNYEVRSCHLTKNMCIQKGFDTSVPDLFDEIFGDTYHCEITEDNFESAMANIEQHRHELSEKAHKLVIISENDMTNVSLELSLFTNNRVMFM